MAPAFTRSTHHANELVTINATINEYLLLINTEKLELLFLTICSQETVVTFHPYKVTQSPKAAVKGFNQSQILFLVQR
jgi:hypothetical protein